MIAWNQTNLFPSIKIKLNIHLQVATAVHEMLHAMGGHHEQSRSDRDNYVTIEWPNVRKGRNNINMKKFSTQDNNPYDAESAMQYSLYVSISWITQLFALFGWLNETTILQCRKQNIFQCLYLVFNYWEISEQIHIIVLSQQSKLSRKCHQHQTSYNEHKNEYRLLATKLFVKNLYSMQLF